ncbi:MAG: hypothetical protein ACKOFP_09220 [Actinomycetota bacterium]
MATDPALTTETEKAPGRRSSFTAIVWLALVAGYSLLLLSIDAMHFEAQVDGALVALAGLAWVAILLGYWRGMARAASKRSYAMGHLGTPLFLVAPLAVVPDTSWLLLFILLTAYVLELRTFAAGHGFIFSLGLVVFVIVLATGVMSYVEREDPESALSDIGTSAAWTFATLFRLRAPVGSPQTEDGQILSLVVGVCALLAASLFTAQIVTWVTGSGRDKGKNSEASPELLAEIAALREAVDRLADERSNSGDSGRQDPPT